MSNRVRFVVLAGTAFGAAVLLQACAVPPTATPTAVTLGTALPATVSPISGSPTPRLTSTRTDTPPLTPTPTAVPTASATLRPVGPASCVPSNSQMETGEVVRVIDGDTIDVRIGGEIYRVRYIGMDTPEVGDPFGAEATARNRELVLDQTVTMVKDVSETDRYGRLLRYVFVGDTFVNYELVVQGYAMASTYPPDVACAGTFVEAQRSALAAGSGLWATGQASPWEGSATPQPSGNCDPSYPTVCIPPPPPDLDCSDITYRRFQVLPPDPHRVDGDHDGVGCEGG